MSSFFTLPASQRKRKRVDKITSTSSKKRNTIASNATNPSSAQRHRDESISGSDSESDEVSSSENSTGGDDSDSEADYEEETAAERRLRLAERYLQNVRQEVDEIGFDAADIDRDLIAERLQEDLGETKGRVYRHIASELDFPSAIQTSFRADTTTYTSIAVCAPYVYTVSKDITLIKWELPHPPSDITDAENAVSPVSRKSKPRQRRRRPTQLTYIKGNKNKRKDFSYQGHTDAILCIAASQDGKFVVTGGRDRKLIVWSASDLKPLRVFTQHRDAVISMVFRRGTNQLYTASKDRTVKVWSLDELAYIETLFGHQDEVVDIAALSMERCISVGARDRTARLWKVAEESQLIFRGGTSHGSSKKHGQGDGEVRIFSEGSMDRIAMMDEETFVTGSDNGSISLWNTQKKKPVFVQHLAHGIEPPITAEEGSSEADPDNYIVPQPQPRWITALTTVPYADLVISGSWDGSIRVWKLSDDKKKLEAIGVVGSKTTLAGNGDSRTDNGSTSTGNESTGGVQQIQPASVRGVVNDIAVFERGDRGKDGLCIVAVTGSEHRLGRWVRTKGKNGAVVFEVERLVKVPNKLTNGVTNGLLLSPVDGENME